MTSVSLFDMFSPTDYRYRVEELKPFLPEEASVRYKAEIADMWESRLEQAGL